MTTPKFAMCDTKRPDGTYVEWECQVLDDDSVRDPRKQDEGITDERVQAWERDEWHYVGIRARANVTVVKNGTGFSFSIDSPGLWAIESDSDEAYLKEVYAEEKAELVDWLKGFSLESTSNS